MSIGVGSEVLVKGGERVVERAGEVCVLRSGLEGDLDAVVVAVPTMALPVARATLASSLRAPNDMSLTNSGIFSGFQGVLGATGEAVAHLNYLINEGQMEVEPDADGVNWYKSRT